MKEIKKKPAFQIIRIAKVKKKRVQAQSTSNLVTPNVKEYVPKKMIKLGKASKESKIMRMNRKIEQLTKKAKELATEYEYQ